MTFEDLLDIQQFLSTPSARRATRAAGGLQKALKNISIHALREEGDHQTVQPDVGAIQFLSTPSARRATLVIKVFAPRTDISIHALREEGDLFSIVLDLVSDRFLSTPSARRATALSSVIGTPINVFLSTPSARRATAGFNFAFSCTSYFYPRPPRGGRRHRPELRFVLALFLSTPSARRATARQWAGAAVRCYFYPRPPRGGRPPAESERQRRHNISIHALREEGDMMLRDHDKDREPISIHALREEGDDMWTCITHRLTVFLSTPSARRATAIELAQELDHLDFYPRPPRGGRRAANPREAALLLFLSTPSARRATPALR